LIGIVALAGTTLVAAFAIATYEAWWTIGLVIMGVALLAVDRSGLRCTSAARVAVGLIGALVLGVTGLWMVLLGVFGKARPCDDCFDNGVLFVLGLIVVVVAIVVAALSIRWVLRAFASKTMASTRDIPPR